MTPFERSLHAPPIWWLLFAVPMTGLVLFVFGTVIYKAITTSARNARAPLLEREATVVGRRQHVWGRQSTRTDYFVTFELADGTREEFAVAGEAFGVLVEGDRGILRSQGTWFKEFQRQRG